MSLVSVIIPTYGIPDLLERCIDSVLRQTYPKVEIIVVDDNNPDTEARKLTEELMQAFASRTDRIQYICHPENKNGAAARNTGLQVAKGKYIAFLDSDDEYCEERIARCVSTMEQETNPNVGGVYTGCEFRRNGKKYHTFMDVKSGNFLKETLSASFMFCTGSNIFILKAIIDELQGFDEAFLRHQDYEFLVRFFEKYDLVAIPEVLVIKNNDNKNLPNPDKMVTIKKQYLEKYADTIASFPHDEQKEIYQKQCIAIAEGYLNTKQLQKASTYYKKANAMKALSANERMRRLALTIRVWLS